MPKDFLAKWLVTCQSGSLNYRRFFMRYFLQIIEISIPLIRECKTIETKLF